MIEDLQIQDCPDCGGGVYTGDDGMVADGDELPCCDCGKLWPVSVDEDGNAWIQEVEE